MATIHLDTGANYPGGTLISQENIMRRPLFPAIRWGAVLAGVAVGISVQLVLTLLGIASGLSMTSVQQGEAPGTGALIWAGISMLISALVGAYVAGRMSGLKRKTDGILHGVVSWAVTTLLFVVLATSAGGSLLSGLFSGVGQGASAMAQSGASAGGLTSLLNRQLGTNVSADNMRTLQGHITAGRRDQAIDYMSSTMGVQRDRASTIVDQALILSGSPDQASPQGRAAADRAIQGASTAAWVVFGAVALSLMLSFVGGALGAMGARRTTWAESDSATSTTATTARTDLGRS
ncbi:MAG: hypothetical protein NBV65_03345 [Burkholderiaceae bacterium]|nr:hypothetical protein [Burkholderiaceae bacterium]